VARPSDSSGTFECGAQVTCNKTDRQATLTRVAGRVPCRIARSVVLEKPPKGLQRFLADMVLDPFGIRIGDIRSDTDGNQKIPHQFVAFSRVFRQTTPVCRQEN
jgi:hypothetical protein